MRVRKLIAVLCTAAMLFSLTVMPVVATSLTDSQKARCIFYNDFESGDLGSWVNGATTLSSDQYSSGVETIDGVKAMKFTTEANGNMFLDFNDVNFSDADEIVIKARIKQTGSTNNDRVYLKLNRPDTTNFGSGKNEIGWNWYTLGCLRGTAYQTRGANDPTIGANLVQTDFANKWVDLEIVLEGKALKSHTTLTVDGTSYGPQTATMAESITGRTTGAYDAAGVDSSVGWTSFNSLTWLISYNSAPVTLYVDYIYAYAVEKLTASLALDLISYKDDIVISTDKTVPAEAVSLVDSSGNTVEAEITGTASSITINPDLNLTEQASYKVVFDSDILENNYLTMDSYELTFTVAKNIPRASNIKIDGKLIPQTTVEADYSYIFEAEEGNSVIEWYASDSENGEFIKIEGAGGKALEVTDELASKYIMYKVKPVSVTSVSAEEFYDSEIISPQNMPVISSLTMSTTSLYVDSNISVAYTYSDADGDKEDGSEIIWYYSENGTDGWTKVSEGKAFKITEECEGKYLKCTVIPKNKSGYLEEGILYETAVAGPVQSKESLLESTNLLVNPGLEDGVIAPWQPTNTGGDYKGIELVTDEVFSGEYAMRVHPRIQNAYDGWYQTVNREAGKRYIFSAMAKKVKNASGVTGFEGYSWNGGFTRVNRDADYVAVGDDWVRVTTGLDSTTSGEANLGFLSFSTLNANVIMDDFYFGEVMLTDIGNTVLETVSIPESGSTRVMVTDGKIYNQFGTVNGLQDQTVTINAGNAQGITVDGNYLVVASNALAGKLTVELVCNPTYAGATGGYAETVEVELIASTNKPKARNVTISGEVAKNSVLTASYEFYHAEGKANASAINWMYSDTENGTYREIPGATGLTYTVEAQYADKFICFMVEPKTADGEVGDKVYSNVIANARVPEASNVKIDGEFKIGGTVTASYNYYDANKDTEGASVYRWMIADSIDGRYSPISGQTTKALTLTEEMIDKYIKFGVTPVSTAAPETGAEVMSEPVLGPAAPTASGLTINQEGARLTGSYLYSHPHNAKEKGTVYKWTVDGMVVSTKASYVIDFTGIKTVTFSVTPAGDTNPSTGNTVSVSVTVSGDSDGGLIGGGTTGGTTGGLGGGYTGGGGSSSGVTNINNMQLPVVQTPEQEESKSDITGHWGEEYVKEMEERGVMAADENGNFDPDKFVTREEMLTYLFKALKLEAAEYTDKFEDVEDGEFASMLQTMVNCGIIAKDTHFRPNDTISREEMCKILCVSLENAEKLAQTEDGLIESFSDYSSVSEWARGYVNSIYGNKIMVGVSDTEFDPLGTVTRAQAATMLTRILTLMEGEA